MHVNNTTKAFSRHVYMTKVVWVDLLLGPVCLYTREKIENYFLTRTELGCISVVAFLYYLQSGLCIIVTLTKSRIRALFRPSL